MFNSDANAAVAYSTTVAAVTYSATAAAVNHIAAAAATSVNDTATAAVDDPPYLADCCLCPAIAVAAVVFVAATAVVATVAAAIADAIAATAANGVPIVTTFPFTDSSNIYNNAIFYGYLRGN
jgi:hypothetical protein